MDGFALGLLIADKMIQDGRIQEFIDKRYSSWTTGIGKDIRDGKADFESLSDYAMKMGEVTTNISGRQENLESIVNQIIMSVQ
jgi:xylose isomerase